MMLALNSPYLSLTDKDVVGKRKAMNQIREAERRVSGDLSLGLEI